MKQKTRDKIALVLTVCLTPVLLFFLIRNIRNAKAKKTGGSSAERAAVVSTTPAVAQPAVAAGQAPGGRRSVNGDAILAEQQMIAAQLPRHNPFSTLRRSERVSASAQNAEEGNFRVTSIVSREEPAQAMAVINGQILEQGDRIGRWEVLGINSQNVVLRSGTEKMTIEVQ